MVHSFKIWKPPQKCLHVRHGTVVGGHSIHSVNKKASKNIRDRWEERRRRCLLRRRGLDWHGSEHLLDDDGGRVVGNSNSDALWLRLLVGLKKSV